MRPAGALDHGCASLLFLAPMASLAERFPLLGRLRASGNDAGAALRNNVGRARALFTRRRHDTRFQVIPYDGAQSLNAVAILATALLMLAFVLDPLLVPWQASLPTGVVDAFHTVTRFGKSDWILVTTGVFVILMLVLDAGELHERLRVRRAVRTLAAAYVFVAVALSGIIVNLAKYGFGRARPKHFAETGAIAFHPWSGDASWASFPSGHATTGMALGMALALIFPRFRWVFLSLGFWIAVSRLFTRAHYPSDVLAGSLVGMLTAWLLARALARRRLVFGFDGKGNLTRRKGASGRFF